ncbi:MBL fold metallo-hydrolase [Geodermatophilus sp. SYSU D00079]
MTAEGPTRRSFLGRSLAVGASLAGGSALGGVLGRASARAGTAADRTPQPVPTAGTSLVTLGTAAGPAVRSPRRGIASAVVVDGHLYLVDCGLGVVRQAVEAMLPMAELRAVLLTHLHSDHVAELPGLLLYNWGAPVDGFTRPFRVLGPGPAGALPDGAEAVVTPATPGTQDVVAALLAAYAYDVNIRVYDEARPPLDDLVVAEDLELPAGVPAGPRGPLAPPMAPFVVYEDERVRVLAALVDHPPVYPSYGFRFETPHGVVAFSGDTAEHANVVELARGADVLVHEAVYLDFYRGNPDYTDEFINHLAQSHTEPEGTGRVAAAAGAGHLVLSHLAGVATDEQWAAAARETFDGPVTVAADGQVFPVA